MPDRVLVTGVSGFLGGHIALALLAAGYAVRGSVRDPQKADAVSETLERAGGDVSRLDFVTLDLMSDANWASAVDGVRFVQHVASPFLVRMPADRMVLIRPAIEGTRRALEAAFAADVERVVLTSSMAAVMYGHDKARTAPFTPDDWTDLKGRGVNAYVESKTRAERAAWEITERHGRSADLAAINPGAILGPLLDADPGTSIALVQRLLKGGMPLAPNMAMVIVDVRDVATLHVKAMTSPTAGGHRFPAGDATYSIMELAAMLRSVLPAHAGKLPRFVAPDWLVRMIGLFDRDLRGNLGELGVIKRADSSAARALLGRPFIPAADALRATANSLIAERLI